MKTQAEDLLEEGLELRRFIEHLTPTDWSETTPFKNWSVNQVVKHLHIADSAALIAITDRSKFRQIVNGSHQESIIEPGLGNKPLLEAWWSTFEQLHAELLRLDDESRIPWFGPDISARMFAAGRQMEIWAHGQDIYDLFIVHRENSDRIRNIAELGVRTFRWSYENRGKTAPPKKPYVALSAPSGKVWKYGHEDWSESISGSAVDFCHVVTQCRNIADTGLKVEGDIVTVGISDYAQKELGDVVFVELPKVGDLLSQAMQCVTIESTKAASEVYAPCNGEVIEVNTELDESPQLINESPFEEGWIFKVKIENTMQIDDLMDELAYREFIASESH